MVEKEKSRELTLERVNEWLERSLKPDEFKKIGVCQAGDGSIWIVNIDVRWADNEKTLSWLAEYCMCSISTHYGSRHTMEKGYCILS